METFGKSLSKLFNRPLTVRDTRSLGGGCISDVMAVEVEMAGLPAENDPNSVQTLVVKRQEAAKVSMFQAEADGINAVSRAGVIRCPKIHVCGTVGDQAFLVMERIESTAQRPRDFFFRFGQSLAELHRQTAGSEIGWSRDNFLGSTHQPNKPRESWVEFFRDQRIGFQLRLAVEQRLIDRKLRRNLESIVERMDEWLEGHSAQTSLLHGDLWSGNYLCDSRGDVVLIDPAVYRGCREAEWGMISWFGRCPGEFQQGYESVWPLTEGWQRRVAVYRLYHQLNHLNLFGGGYVETCRHGAATICRTSD